jgi:hypothetical protein
MSNRTPGRPPAPRRSAVRRASTPKLHRHAASPTDEPMPTARLEVEPRHPPEHLFRRLLSAYLAGACRFEVIERPALTAATREVVEEFCRRTRQPELFGQEEDRLRVRESDVGGTDELDDRLLRLGTKVVRFHRDAVASWDRLSFEDDRSWERKDDDIDREAWYVERGIAFGERVGHGLGRPATGAGTIARSLERIADHAVTLGELGPRLADLGRPGGPAQELRQFHRQAMAHLEEVLASSDGSRANDLLDVGEALLTAGRALSERLLPAVGDGSMAPAAAAAVARAIEAIARTVAYAQDIAQAFFDRSGAVSLAVATEDAPPVAMPSAG